MRAVDSRKAIIQHAGGEVRDYTGTPAYDLTYGELCSAGAGLRIAIESNDQALAARHARHLILGVDAWNPSWTYPYDPQLPLTRIAEGERSETAIDLVKVVRAYESVDRHDDANAPIERGMGVLGVENGVAVASKLLHFLSPGYLPILDNNVQQALVPGSPRPGIHQYQCYAAALRELGITAHGPDGPDERVTAFGDSTVAPARRVRRVDCTLWSRGPNR